MRFLGLSLAKTLTDCRISNLLPYPSAILVQLRAMFNLLFLWLGALGRAFRSRNLALRQQLTVLKRRRPRPILGLVDKLFWVVARRVWPGWKQPLIVVTPETVVRWHGSGFRLYWRLISRRSAGVDLPDGRREPNLGAPRIHGELLMLGFDVSERTISRWMKRAPRDPESAKRWLAFLRNHRAAIAAMDFFTVPTITFWVLALLLLRRQPRSSAHPAFQYHQASDEHVDRPAVAGSISV
jgi:hypothetical protein